MFKSLISTKFSLTLLLSLLMIASSLNAEYIPPDHFDVETQKYELEVQEVEVGEFKYAINWEAIPVASATIKVFPPSKNGTQKVEVTAKTTKLIGLFYKLTHKSLSIFDSSSFKLKQFHSDQKENSKRKLRKFVLEDNKVRSEYWKNNKLKQRLIFYEDNGILDPIAGALFAKSVSVKLGDTYTFDVFNGKHRFLLSFLPKAIEEVYVDGNKYKAYKIVPKVKRLTDTKKEKRLKSAVLWISADESRRILKVESRVWIGSVTAELDSYKPLPKSTLKNRTYARNAKD